MAKTPVIPPRLSGLARFSVCFVETDLEHLADYQRGECFRIEERQGHKYFEVTGEGAGIDRPFGYDTGHIVNPFKDSPFPAEQGLTEKLIEHEKWVCGWLPENTPCAGTPGFRASAPTQNG